MSAANALGHGGAREPCNARELARVVEGDTRP
jgi:hypothetical protein